MKVSLFRTAALTVLVGTLVLPIAAGAETLGEVKRRNFFEVCAGPDALPYSSQTSEPQGFQLDLARMIADDLGVALRVDWIHYTRFAQRTNCDALMGVILKDEGSGMRGVKPTIPYTGSGWVLVLPKDALAASRFEDVKGSEGIGVQYASWVHYILDSRKMKTRQFQNDQEILEALNRGEISAGAVVNTYAGWYVHVRPEEGLKLAPGYTPESELRWNVAVGLRNADQALVDAINEILRKRIADGTVKAIIERYGIPYYPPFKHDVAQSR
ncbi:MAG TPA: transporter substrate-binding domain-containing protein [Burkholderiales bacterium]|nr:transporter substrate-binding domain-containing protein [Burkholderiales bacterium]